MTVRLSGFGIPPGEKIGSSDPVNEKQELANRFLLFWLKDNREVTSKTQHSIEFSTKKI